MKALLKWLFNWGAPVYKFKPGDYVRAHNRLFKVRSNAIATDQNIKYVHAQALNSIFYHLLETDCTLCVLSEFERVLVADDFIEPGSYL